MKIGNTSFERPVGPHGDEKELEYVSALLQTGKLLRVDGSIRPIDVKLFLNSRYGVDVQEEVIKELIFKDLAGSMSQATPTTTKQDLQDGNTQEEEDDVHMDLAQFVAILMIPHFLDPPCTATIQDDGESSTKKLEDSMRQPKTLPDLISTLSKGMFGQPVSSSSSDVEGASVSGQALRALLARHGEHYVSEESLQDMLRVLLESPSLADALNGDIQAFDNDWKHHTTTSFHDAVHVDPQKTFTLNGGNDTLTPLDRKSTFSFVDFMADTYRRPRYVMGLWTAGVFSYMSYVYGSAEENERWTNLGCGSGQGCQLLEGVIAWLEVLIHLSTMGLAFIFFSSFGNSVYAGRDLRSLSALVVAIIAVTACTVLPFFVKTSNTFFSTAGNKDYDQTYVVNDDVFYGGLEPIDDDEKIMTLKENGWNFTSEKVEYKYDEDPFGGVYIIALIMGCSLLLILLVDLILLLVPRAWAEAHPLFHSIFSPGGPKAECAQKKASYAKITSMVNGALQVHLETATHSKTDNYNEVDVLHTFHRHKNDKEEIGGIMWTWSRMFDASLFNEEGVWFHSRLLSIGMAQFLVSVLVIFLGVSGYTNYDAFEYTEAPTVQEQSNSVLSNTFYGFLNCTTTMRDELFGLDQRSAAFSLAALDIDGLIDLYAYGIPDGATVMAQSLANATLSLASDCLGNSVSPNEANLLGKFTGVYDCMVSEVGYLNYNGDLIYASDLLRLQYVDDFGGPAGVEKMLLDCGADDQIVRLVMNTTVYNPQAEEESALGEIMEELGIDKSGYFAIITVGTFFALAACAYIPIVLFPSFVSQVLRFRSGVTPSLHDAAFFTPLRHAPDTAATLFPSSFWGTLISALAAGTLAAVVTVFLVSDVGGNFGPTLLGILLGFVTILALRLGALLSLRGVLFRNFYRTNVAASNIMFVVLEAWNIALTAGFMLGRVIMITLVSILFIARVDTPFMAPGIGEVGPIKLDGLPFAFRRDLLSHEAHRHPYLELFGLICLVKLRCGASGFATRSHSALRLLAVLTLMPWLKKYRQQPSSNASMAADSDDTAHTQESDAIITSKNKESSRKSSSLRTRSNDDTDLSFSALRQKKEKLARKLQEVTRQLESLRHQDIISDSGDVYVTSTDEVE